MKLLQSSKLAAGLLATALLATACGGGSQTGDATSGEAVKVGITQYVTHASLDASREGFKKALADAGYTGDKIVLDEQNAQADAATNTSIAGKFASDGLDLVLAIATPSAQAAVQAISDAPILFTAVTDPVAADLVDSMESPGGNATGTSDGVPDDVVVQQLELIKELDPEAKSIGVVYSSGEVNSAVQVDAVKEAAAGLGLEVKEATVSVSGEVQQAAQSLDVDAFYIPTDNNVVSALSSLIQVAEEKKVLTIAAEGDSVRNGAVATWGIDYEKLGYQTGEMAVKILKGEATPADLPVETQTKMNLYVNPAAAERMGVELPAGFVEKADVEITE